MARVEADASPVEEVLHLSDLDRRLRYLAASLGDGLPLQRADYRSHFGRDVESDFGDAVQTLAGLRLLSDDGEQITVTDTGALIYDLVMLAFYPQDIRDWLTSQQGAANQRREIRSRVG